MTIVGLHDFVKVSISALLKSFLLIMCIDAPESTTNFRSSSLRVDADRHLFSESEKNAALLFSFNFDILLASFHAASRAPCSCHSVSSWDRSSNCGALGLRWWGHLGKLVRAKDFGLECMRDVQQLLWILHVGSVSLCLNSSVKSTKTSAAPYPGIRNPIVVYLMGYPQQVRDARELCQGKQRVSPFYHAAHASSTKPLHFCHHSLRTFCYAVHQPGDAHKSTFHQICNHTWSCRTGILEGATFHSMNWCKFLWGNCMAIETFYHWDSFLWDFGFSTFFSLSAAWKKSETDSAVSFLHVYWHRDGNCNCLL